MAEFPQEFKIICSRCILSAFCFIDSCIPTFDRVLLSRRKGQGPLLEAQSLKHRRSICGQQRQVFTGLLETDQIVS